jgi:hypothetical protein
MSPDPDNGGAEIAFPQSWNAYAYVLNKTLIYVDPSGRDCVYLNDAGNGLDGPQAIDRESSRGECVDTGGVWFDGTINSNSVRTDPGSDWVFAEGVDVGDMGTNAQYSCGGAACGQDALTSFTDSIAGGSPTVVTDNSDALSPSAAAILGQVYRDARVVSDASEVAACAAAGFVLGKSGASPLVTHTVVEGAAKGLENPKTATFAARAYHTATDARFTAGGKFSKVLVPRTAAALHPVLAGVGKKLNVAGWVYSGYEAVQVARECARELK